MRERYPAQLSGGERQRVGVARALAADPPLMLMDEPFGAVDPIVRERLQNEFLRLQEDLAKTILFVTHDIDEAIKLGDLVAVMQAGGTLAQFGPPEEILTAPASDFVARFVGTDRGLKRLSLTDVADVQARPAVTARVAGDAAEARSSRGGRPGAIRAPGGRQRSARSAGSRLRRLVSGAPLSADLAQSTSPLFEPNDTLKDALGRLLGAGVETGMVVDERGAVRGLLSFSDFGELLRDETPDAPS